MEDLLEYSAALVYWLQLEQKAPLCYDEGTVL